jgi:HTH-type transcriptional regulator/antitoxin MqsA
MTKTPRNYPETMASAESGRPMMRGEKLVSFKIEGRSFTYRQPGWWCSLTDPDDMEGQLVDDDNQIADMARRTAKALAHGEKVFVPVVIRAIRQRCGLTQREAGLLFGTGEKSFEKYESGEIQPFGADQAIAETGYGAARTVQPAGEPAADRTGRRDPDLVRAALAAAHVDQIYGRLFAEP